MGGHGRCGARKGAAETLFIGDDALAADLAVDGDDGRVPTAAPEGVEEVVEPGLDPHLDAGKVRGDALDEANGKVALLADGVRNVEKQLPPGHRIHRHDSRGLCVSHKVLQRNFSMGWGLHHWREG